MTPTPLGQRAAANAPKKKAAKTPRARSSGKPVTIMQSATIHRPPAELYAFWRNLKNLPRFMNHIESVEVTGPETFRWTARGAAGRTLSWESQIIEDVPGERIAWQSLPGSALKSTTSVVFHQANGGGKTSVQVEIAYVPPSGKTGEAMKAIFGADPERQVIENLNRFRALAELGQPPFA